MEWIVLFGGLLNFPCYKDGEALSSFCYVVLHPVDFYEFIYSFKFNTNAGLTVFFFMFSSMGYDSLSESASRYFATFPIES